MNFLFKNVSDIAKIIVGKVIEPGDYVLDGTAGNGRDTLFLAELVSDNGKVFSFDIQSQAIKITKAKLIENNYINRVELILSSHEYIERYIKNKIKAAMFNLGYLPGGDHSIITRGDSTVSAIKQTLGLLLPGGLISICLYSGHYGGREESELVSDFTANLSNRDYNVIKLDYINKKNNPPNLIIIEKINYSARI